MRDIIKKLPKLRGHGKNRSESVFYRGPEAVVNLSSLNVFAKGDAVNPTALIAHGLIKEVLGKVPVVKILGTGDVSVALTVTGCAVSETARTKIEKAGGTISITVKPKPQTEAQLKKIADKKAKKLQAKSGKKGGSKKSK
jgi:large subunit ribosomal protein L15